MSELDPVPGHPLQTLPPPLTRRPGTPAPVVNACRAFIAEAARDLDPLYVDAVSAGRAVRGADGILRAPIEVQIIYSRGSGEEVRQSVVECHVDGDDRVVAMNDVYKRAEDLKPEPAPAQPNESLLATGSLPQPLADGGEVVEAFYRALGSGDGEEAAQYVVPEKQVDGPLSAREISAYFGGLARPLRAERIVQAGARQFDVRYSYRIGRRECTGSARVTLTSRNSVTYIEGIRATEDCS
jgi:hypothetical protein